MGQAQSFSGAGASTLCSGNVGSSDTTISVGAVSSWPNTGTYGPFVVTIDRGLANEERILISSYTSTVLTVASGGRGYDGTTATTHTNGTSKVELTIDGAWHQDVSQHVYNGTRNDHTQYALCTPATAGAPASGTYLTGQMVIDKNGIVYRCTAGGTPGTWAAETVSLLAVLAAVYPVGCIYAETTGTNPNTTFGFGTWAAYGAGRVMIGVGTGTDSNSNTLTVTSAGTAGEYTHKLLAAEGSQPGFSAAVTITDTHVHEYAEGATSSSSSAQSPGYNTLDNLVPSNTTGTSSGSITASNASVSAATAVNYHNNTQPWIGTYFWKRTA